jgi:hypothetical protein
MKLLACFLALLAAAAQTSPAGWKVIKDQRGTCQVAVPPDWIPSTRNPGVASAKDVLEGMVVVTGDSQRLKPIPESMQKVMKIEKLYENTDKRVVYMTHIARDAKDSSSLSVAVPAQSGSCMTQVTYRSTISDDLAKKIAFTVGPAK